jgi:hypothetical protein
MIQPSTTSPRWSSTTKLLVGLVIIGIMTEHTVHESSSAGFHPGLSFAPCCRLHGLGISRLRQYSLFVDRDTTVYWPGGGESVQQVQVLLIR